MSLERKDVRFKPAPDLHQALAVLAECAHVEIGEYVETVVEREVLRRVHEATLIASAAQRAGIAGVSRASAGTAWRAGS